MLQLDESAKKSKLCKVPGYMGVSFVLLPDHGVHGSQSDDVVYPKKKC